MILYLVLFIGVMILLHVRYKMGYAWKDIFSLKRWRAIYVWLLKRNLKWLGENNKYLTRNELIQYSYRVAKCGDCIQAGKCVHCGCDAEGRFNGTSDVCSQGNWGVFLSDEELDNLLKDNKLIYNVKLEKK